MRRTPHSWRRSMMYSPTEVLAIPAVYPTSARGNAGGLVALERAHAHVGVLGVAAARERGAARERRALDRGEGRARHEEGEPKAEEGVADRAEGPVEVCLGEHAEDRAVPQVERVGDE